MSREDLFDSMTPETMRSRPGLKWGRDPSPHIPLFIAAPDFPIAPEIKAALVDAVQREDLYYNTDEVTREAMADKVARVNGVEATADDIMIIQGVDPGIWLAASYACKPGDEIVVTDPTYGPLMEVVPKVGAKPVVWELDMDEGYVFDVERLKELVTDRTRLINLCNPHNPCGRVLTREELKGVADVAVDNGIVVASDELWEDVVFDGREHVSIASLNPEIEGLTVTSWGLSKTFGVAGLQLGYLCAKDGEMMAGFKRLARLIQRGSSTLAKAVAPMMLGEEMDWWREGLKKHLHKIRALCEERLDEMPGVSYPKLQGTYAMFPRFDYGKTSRELVDYMREEAKIGLSNGAGYGKRGEGHLRMIVATSESIMTEVLDRMEKALRKLG
ncbi:pyridoxal phosphate-dependent aminotransferase [Candidatus Bathyarchaeota archaeon]|nr:pyridoxal phosphate-dependent aminotransferase [Candidatus Bathyarchaeota archaeon]